MTEARKPHRRGFVSLLMWAAAVGAVVGLLDAGNQLAAEMTPSAARRLWLVCAYGAGLSALLVLVMAGLVESVVRLGRALDWRLAAGNSSSLRWLGWSALIACGSLLARSERRYWFEPVDQRRLHLAVSVLAPVAVALAIALLLRRLPRERLRRWSTRRVRPAWWLGVMAVAVLVAGIRLVSSLPARTDHGTAHPSARADSPNLVLIVADTLRADALGCYGAEPSQTPHIDSLARRGVLFSNSVATASWTLPSVVSLLSSTYPSEHGVTDFTNTVPPDLLDLPQILSRAGVHTYAAVGNVTMTRQRGFGRGFDVYDVWGHHPEARLMASRVVSGIVLMSASQRSTDRGKRPLLWPSRSFPFFAFRWSHYTYDLETVGPLVERLEAGIPTPFFLYLHLMAPHEPYLRHPRRRLDFMPALHPENREELLRRYLGEVGYLDQAVGELLRALDGSGHSPDTVVAFVADHGEAFLEHGRWAHGRDLYQEVLRVPMILAGPGLPAGIRWHHRTSLVDVAPTLLDLAAIDPPGELRGRSLLPFLLDPATPLPSRPVFAQTSSRMLTPKDRFDAVLDGRWKLIRREERRSGRSHFELYDLERDPDERSPLPADAGPDDLRALLESFAVTPEDTSTESLSERELEVLRALGYVN